MDIQFTGFRNASYIVNTTKNGSIPMKERILNVQLTDDELGKDLSEFKNIIKNTGGKFFNKINKDFVNINYFSINRDDAPAFLLNGKLLQETDENLPIFTFIGKLTKKITKIPEESFVNDLDYLKFQANRSLLLDRNLSEELDEEFPYCLERFHQPQKIKKGAAKINKELQNMMIEYLA